MLEVHYNIKSPFGPALSSGSTRVKDDRALGAWIRQALSDTTWPVIITSVIDLEAERFIKESK